MEVLFVHGHSGTGGAPARIDHTTLLTTIPAASLIDLDHQFEVHC
jgi:hypothetical protein